MEQAQKDIFFMKQALRLAHKAYALDEIPVGALIVSPENKIIGRGYNQAFKKKSQNMHAEMIALNKATKKIGDWRLEHCTLYVTLEPCAMCLSFALLSRIERIVYGAESPLFGACLEKSTLPLIYTAHLKEVSQDIESAESASLLKRFFKKRRAAE